MESYMSELSKKNITLRYPKNTTNNIAAETFFALNEQEVKAMAQWTRVSVKQGEEYWKFQLVLSFEGYIDYITYDKGALNDFPQLSKNVKIDYQDDVVGGNTSDQEGLKLKTTVILSSKRSNKIPFEGSYSLKL